jgi:hypothetical protein
MGPPTKNPKGPLPADDKFEFAPQEIVLAVLSMDRDEDGNLGYGIVLTDHIPPPKGEATISEAQLRKLLKRVADPDFDPGAPFLRITPWDIPVRKQCYLVLVLDPRIRNWGFHGDAVESKGGCDAYDFNPFWVLPGDDRPQRTPIRKGELPKVVFFSVGRRGAKKPHGLDYHVRVVDPNGRWELPVIYDPDVPNDGDSEFPPPKP